MIIPDKLKHCYFVKIRSKSKIPYEKNWQNKGCKYNSILEWISKGNNYGILTGINGLIVIDADNKVFENLILKKFPPTFTVKTPNKGSHFYYICPEINKKQSIKSNDKSIHYGDILSNRSQAIGAGSTLSDNKVYYVSNNIEINTITKEIIDKIIEELLSIYPEPKKEFIKLQENYGKPYFLVHKTLKINETFWAALYKIENNCFYNEDTDTFYIYNDINGVFCKKNHHVIKQEISKRILQTSQETNISKLELQRSNHILEQIIKQLKGLIIISEMRNNNNIIHLENGMIDIHNNKKILFTNFSPKYFSTSILPIKYNKHSSCNNFINQLLSPVLYEEDIGLLQKYLGMCLIGENLIQKFLILEGGTGTGKSTLISIIQKIIGEHNISQLRTQHIHDRFELHRYKNKKVLFGVDVTSDFLTTKGSYYLKSLIGNDRFDAEIKNSRDNCIIEGKFCIIITTNTKLKFKIDDDTDAWSRRILRIRFKNKKPQTIITDLANKIFNNESSGILNWMLQGLINLFIDIDNYGDIKLNERQKNNNLSLIDNTYRIKLFIKNNIIYKGDNSLTIAEIIDYLEKNNIVITITKSQLITIITDYFPKINKSNSIKRNGKDYTGFRNIKFKEATNDY